MKNVHRQKHIKFLQRTKKRKFLASFDDAKLFEGDTDMMLGAILNKTLLRRSQNK